MNSAYISVSSLKVFNDSQGVSRLNLTLSLTTDMMIFTADASLRSKSEENLRDYNNEVLRSRLNLGKISEGIIGNFFVKFFVDNVKDYSNFKLSTPLKADEYYFRNFPVVDDSYLPRFNTKDVHYFLSLVFKGKPRKSKALKNIATIKMFGSLKP